MPAHTKAGVKLGGASVSGTSAAAPASARASLDVCVAVALLTGHDPKGCGSSITSSTPVSLTSSLADVGACARVAAAAGQPIDTCGTPVAPGTPLVGDVVAGNDLCPVVNQLGLGTTATEACLGAEVAAAQLMNGDLSRLTGTALPGGSTGSDRLARADRHGGSSGRRRRARARALGADG